MDEHYLIDDNRESSSFKSKTFSGFKKTDVLNTVIKSIDSKKIEQACHWTTECIISGYTIEIFRNAVLNLEKGQNEAGKILGLNK